MEFLKNFLSESWVLPLGWTLIHSLWQGLVIILLVVALLRIVPTRFSNHRYIIACAGLAGILIASVATFFFLNTSAASVNHIHSHSSVVSFTVQNGSDPINEILFFKEYLAAHMDIILFLWLIGACVFSLRLFGCWIFVIRMKQRATLLDNEWSKRLVELATQLKINSVGLAESMYISSPMVIGFFKPVVLVPIGLLTGLTTEQVETIFLHELAHVKRQDYLVNVIQSIIEIVLFFNPFVWMLSNIIRREREYCCDDAVVLTHVNKLAYAHALARLEEARLSGNTLAISLASNRNLLLIRIKRIMENSLEKPSGRMFFIPAVLIIVGLVCASWLSISTEKLQEKSKLASDTSIVKQDKKSARYAKRTVITLDENGEPKEEVIEEFEGDERLHSFFNTPKISVIPAIPPIHAIPVIPNHIVTIPPSPNVRAFVMPFALYDGDTIPNRSFSSANGRWEEFNAEFEEKFRERFENFFEEHEEDLESMMKELSAEFSHTFSGEEWNHYNHDVLEHAQEVNMEALEHLEIPMEGIEEAIADAEVARVEAMEHMNEWQQEHQHEMQDWERDDALNLDKLNEDLQVLEENTRNFEKELKDELVKDGYFTKDEQIKNFEWSNGEIKVNNKKIKDSHKKKYNELHNRFFQESSSHFRSIE
jgi:beta-lactamase regulating signal transducer with metallopeptidase domain